MTYQITANEQFNSIEITFDGKPSEAIRTALKELRFRWHNLKKVWYGYTDEETARKAIETATAEPTKAPTTKTATKTEKVNKYGVKVGDVFSSSWGYEQTNVEFYQVIQLVGETAVRVVEVVPPMTDEKAVSSMSADRTYKITGELLPRASRSLFIKDQTNGDLKRIKLGFDSDPEKAKENCSIKLSECANAYKCKLGEVTAYESWYY